MTILLHKPYLKKVTTKEGGGSKIPKILTTWFMDDHKWWKEEHHLMNNSKSGRQDISRSEKIKKPKCKTTKEAERGNHYSVNSQCLQMLGFLPVGDIVTRLCIF